MMTMTMQSFNLPEWYVPQCLVRKHTHPEQAPDLSAIVSTALSCVR